MKNLLTGSIILLALAASTPLFGAEQKILDIRPAAVSDKTLTGVEWENTNDCRLAAATTDEVLSGFAASETAAMALLAKVKGAYLTDPLVARQIAAVSQWVMVEDDVAWFDFWSATPRADGRKIWVNALMTTAEQSRDAYVKEFCLDQLRWCGCDCPCLISRIRACAAGSGDKAVADFASVVIRELEGKAVGR